MTKIKKELEVLESLGLRGQGNFSKGSYKDINHAVTDHVEKIELIQKLKGKMSPSLDYIHSKADYCDNVLERVVSENSYTDIVLTVRGSPCPIINFWSIDKAH